MRPFDIVECVAPAGKITPGERRRILTVDPYGWLTLEGGTPGTRYNPRFFRLVPDATNATGPLRRLAMQLTSQLEAIELGRGGWGSVAATVLAMSEATSEAIRDVGIHPAEMKAKSDTLYHTKGTTPHATQSAQKETSQ